MGEILAINYSVNQEGVVRKSSQVMDQHLCTTKLVRLTSLLTVTQPK